MDVRRTLTYHKFLESITGCDTALYEAAMVKYLSIVEGNSTEQALDYLRNQVGENNLETDGAGIFDLSKEAGYTDDKSTEELVDDAIDAGMDSGSLDDFGTALSTDDGLPTEGDFGLDDASVGGDDFGLDTVGTDDTSFDDSDASDDSVNDGSMDDTLPDDGVADDAGMMEME